MKILLEIDDNRTDFFLELLTSLKYIKVLNSFEDYKSSKHFLEFADAFQQAKEDEQGRIQLPLAKDVLNEI